MNNKLKIISWNINGKFRIIKNDNKVTIGKKNKYKEAITYLNTNYQWDILLLQHRLGLIVSEHSDLSKSLRGPVANPGILNSKGSAQISRHNESETNSFGSPECLLASQCTGFGSWDAQTREFLKE